MKFKFVYLLAFTAFVLSSTAALFSVIGMASLFSGAFWSVVVMISGLELAKLVTASYLYRHWSITNKLFKTYLIVGIVSIMIITSAGVYGFLSSAYSEVSNKINKIDKQIEFFERKKVIIQQDVDRLSSDLINKNKRIDVLSSIRGGQEARIDSLYKRGYVSSVKRTEGIIKESNMEIGKINDEINYLGKSINSLQDSINKIDLSILSLKNSDETSEIGPLRYIAVLTNKSVDSVVNFFILLLIFVFDPLAVCLVIATNKVLLRDSKEIEGSLIKNEIMKHATIDKPLEPIDEILNKYCEVCKRAAEDDSVFNTFKSHPDVLTVLEHASKDLGERYLQLIHKDNPWLLDIKAIWDNDKYGSPKLETYSIGDVLIRCSPTTLQYIGVVSNLIKEFSSLIELNIVEIGGGYGGQCKIIQDIYDVCSYDLIDLEEVILLQEKYLKKLNCFSNVNVFSDLKYAAIKYDLVISNYALSEVSEKEQLEYVRRILLNSKHGYITCNSPLNGMNLIEDKFDTFRILKDIEGERDTNYIIIW